MGLELAVELIQHNARFDRAAPGVHIEIENAVVKQINEAAYETKIKNMSYQVHEVKYAIFPQRSGTLEIPKQTFSALLANRRRSGSVFDNFGSVRRGRPISAESKTHSVEVLPKAPAYTGKHWLPAGKISLIESWSKDLGELKAGEPVTRSVIVEAIGLQGSQYGLVGIDQALTETVVPAGQADIIGQHAGVQQYL